MDTWMIIFLGVGALGFFLVAFLIHRRDKRARNTGADPKFSQMEIADAQARAANTPPPMDGFGGSL